VAHATVDLRSDTVTRPSPGMRRAMAEAAVGDDVYGEDPSITELERRVAELFGMAAAVFVPSGTMGNQICLRVLVPPGEELVCDSDAHLVSYEGGGAAVHGGIQTRTVTAPRGLLDPAGLRGFVRPAGEFTVPTRAVAVEQTHNRGGGSVYPMQTLTGIAQMCRLRALAVHCDGARIWNAHVATGVPFADYGRLFDTMSVCLSKGLGAPVGSVALFADAQALGRARAIRRVLGGGMRQAGLLAAAGLWALDHNLDRLADDHRRARRLADAAAAAAPGSVRPEEVETNIVVLRLAGDGEDPAAPSGRFVDRCRDGGVLVTPFGPGRVRLVTHLDVDDEDVDRAGEVVGKALIDAGPR
jgi:threonine aldolase